MNRPMFHTLFFLIFTTSLLGQSTLHVDIAGNAPFTSIQAAINAASPGDTIMVEPGVYAERLGIQIDVTLRSTQGPQSTAIAPPPALGTPVIMVGDFNLFALTQYHVVLDGFRISGAVVPSASSGAVPGGIKCIASDLVLRNCVVTGCAGNIGTGILTDGGAGAIEFQGAVFLPVTPHLTLDNCVVSNNLGGDATTAAFGFGVGGTGGVLLASGTTCTIRHCTFAGNVGGAGGGTPAIGPGGPGGVFAEDGNGLTIQNSVFWGNQAGTSVGSFTQDNIEVQTGLPTISHSDVLSTFIGLGNIVADPAFVAPASGDYSLQAGSPCIEAADCSVVNPFSRDLAGNPRLRGSSPDMGPYEFPYDTKGIGTSEDLLLTTVVNGDQNGALVNTKTIAGGDTLLIHWESPCGNLDGQLYYLGAQFYDPAQTPIPPAPFVYLDAMGGSIIQGPAQLAFGGDNLMVNVPPGSFAPTVFRVQVLVVTPMATVLPFAVTSDAHDLQLQ